MARLRRAANTAANTPANTSANPVNLTSSIPAANTAANPVDLNQSLSTPTTQLSRKRKRDGANDGVSAEKRRKQPVLNDDAPSQGTATPNNQDTNKKAVSAKMGQLICPTCLDHPTNLVTTVCGKPTRVSHYSYDFNTNGGY
jgi:hypothetical protein